MGSWLLCDIGGDEIKAYQAKRKAAGASARTLNKELQVLRQVLKRHKLWANLQGEVRFEAENEEIGKALTPDEEAQLLKVCASNQLLDTVVTVTLNTTLRQKRDSLATVGSNRPFQAYPHRRQEQDGRGNRARDSVESAGVRRPD
jgi:hypothetical protein